MMRELETLALLKQYTSLENAPWLLKRWQHHPEVWDWIVNKANLIELAHRLGPTPEHWHLGAFVVEALGQPAQPIPFLSQQKQTLFTDFIHLASNTARQINASTLETGIQKASAILRQGGAASLRQEAAYCSARARGLAYGIAVAFSPDPHFFLEQLASEDEEVFTHCLLSFPLDAISLGKLFMAHAARQTSHWRLNSLNTLLAKEPDVASEFAQVLLKTTRLEDISPAEQEVLFAITHSDKFSVEVYDNRVKQLEEQLATTFALKYHATALRQTPSETQPLRNQYTALAKTTPRIYHLLILESLTQKNWADAMLVFEKAAAIYREPSEVLSISHAFLQHCRRQVDPATPSLENLCHRIIQHLSETDTEAWTLPQERTRFGLICAELLEQNRKITLALLVLEHMLRTQQLETGQVARLYQQAIAANTPDIALQAAYRLVIADAQNPQKRRWYLHALILNELWQPAYHEYTLFQKDLNHTGEQLTVPELIEFGKSAFQTGQAVATQEIIGKIPLDQLNISGKYILAQALISTGDAVPARQILQEIAEAEPTREDVYLLWGKIHADSGENAESLLVYRKGLQFCPNSPQLHLQAGHQYMMQAEYTSAARHLNQAHQNLTVRTPDDVKEATYIGYANGLLELNAHQQAIAVLQNALAALPTNPRIGVFLAKQYLEMGKELEARAVLDGLLRQGVQDQAIRLLQARLLLLVNQWDEALVLLTPLRQETPENTEAYLLSGEACLVGKKYAAALQHFERLTSSQATDKDTGIRSAIGYSRAAIQLGMPGAALEQLTRAEQRFPGQPVLQAELAETLLLVGKTTEAAEMAFHILQNENSPETLRWFDAVFLSKINQPPLREWLLNHTAQLQDTLRPRLHQFPAAYPLKLHMAELTYLTGDFSSSEEQCEQLLEHNNREPELATQELLRLSQLLGKLGKYPAKAKLLNQTLAKTTSSADKASILIELGTAHLEMENPGKAMHALEEALNLPPLPSLLQRKALALKCQALYQTQAYQEAAALLMENRQDMLADAANHGLAAKILEATGQTTLAHQLIHSLLSEQNASPNGGTVEPEKWLQNICNVWRFGISQNNREICTAAAQALRIAPMPFQYSLQQYETYEKIVRLAQYLSLIPVQLTIPTTLSSAHDTLLDGLLKVWGLLAERRFTAAVQHFDTLPLENYTQQDWLAVAYNQAANNCGRWDQGVRTLQICLEKQSQNSQLAITYAEAMANRYEIFGLCQITEAALHSPRPEAVARTTTIAFQEVLARLQKIEHTASQDNHMARLKAHALAKPHRREHFDGLLKQLAQIAIQPPQQPASITDMVSDSLAMQANLIPPLYYRVLAEKLKSTQPALAQEALQTALTYWEEPAWHHLVALWCQESPSSECTPETILQSLNRAIALDPGNPKYYISKARWLLEHQQVEAAISSLLKGTTKSPKSVELWLHLGKIYMEIEHYANAIRCFDQALSHNPRHIETLIHRAELALQVENPEMAATLARRALEIRPHDPHLLIILARGLAAIDQLANATQAILEATRHNEQASPEVFMQAVQLLHKGQEYQKASEVIERALAKYPNDPVILAPYAETLSKLGKHEAALQAAEQALNGALQQFEEAEQAHFHFVFGQILKKAQKVNEAIDQYIQALAKHVQHLDACLELGKAYQQQKNTEDALASFQQAMQIAPMDHRGYLSAGVLLKESKDYPQAETLLRQAAELAPNDIEIQKQLAAVRAINLIYGG